MGDRQNCVISCIFVVPERLRDESLMTKRYTDLTLLYFTGRLLFDVHDIHSNASSLKQIADLLCAEANSASYPRWDRK